MPDVRENVFLVRKASAEYKSSAHKTFIKKTLYHLLYITNIIQQNRVIKEGTLLTPFLCLMLQVSLVPCLVLA